MSTILGLLFIIITIMICLVEYLHFKSLDNLYESNLETVLLLIIVILMITGFILAYHYL
mgnify:CR=1 FL=1